jgi:GT2 family glycosyltransferase
VPPLSVTVVPAAPPVGRTNSWRSVTMTVDSDTQTVPVLYVGGMGRSGSTILERLIGQIDGVCNLGEVVFLADRGVRENQTCGCGELFAECPFWTKVGDLAFGGWDTVDVDRMDHLFRTVDDVKYTPRMLLPRSTEAFDRRRAEYTSFFRRVYAAAAEVSGAAFVVDSSKQTSLVYALSHEKGIGLRLLHLVRDPRGVANSWTRRVRRPEITDHEEFMPVYRPSYMAALWSGHNLLLAALRLRGVSAYRLNYEQFTADPRGALQAVARFLGRPDVALDFVADDNRTVTLNTTHSVAGNPMRFQTGPVAVRRDRKWRREMPRRAQLLVGAMTLPVARAFGYRVWRQPSYRLPAVDAVAAPAATVAAAVTIDHWPSVTAVVPSHGRPKLLREAITAILAQDYPGRLDVIVVHDREPEDVALTTEFPGRVRVTSNDREPGLSGARNTGILLADADLIAFCDDDDRWRADKLCRQVERLAQTPSAVMATTAMEVDFAGALSVRTADTDTVEYETLLVSRMAMLHSSSFLVRRSALLGDVGLLDEHLPGSMGEDWDLLLRAARVAPIAHVDEPLVEILWGSSSFFSRDWHTRLAANDWFLERYPEINEYSAGVGRLAGQSAFFAAASGDRRAALRYAGHSLSRNPAELRAWLALPVIVAPQLGTVIMGALHRRGRGI